MAEPTIEQRLSLSDEATRLLDDTLFNGLLNAILRDYMLDLMKTVPGTTEAMVPHAGMIALEDIKKRLTLMKNDGAVLRKKLKD